MCSLWFFNNKILPIELHLQVETVVQYRQLPSDEGCPSLEAAVAEILRHFEGAVSVSVEDCSNQENGDVFLHVSLVSTKEHRDLSDADFFSRFSAEVEQVIGVKKEVRVALLWLFFAKFFETFNLGTLFVVCEQAEVRSRCSSQTVKAHDPS